LGGEAAVRRVVLKIAEHSMVERKIVLSTKVILLEVDRRHVNAA
jgi:hypothetical protein